MSSILEYLDNNPQEAQRLVGLKYEQLKNLIAKTEELHTEKQLSIEAQKKQLSLAEKEQNKELAKKRIFVEHLIRLVKVWRIAQERFRLNARKYEQIVLIICGLVRLRIKGLILSG